MRDRRGLLPFNRPTDIFPGGGSSVPFQLTAVDGALFFIAADGSTGIELWKHDPPHPHDDGDRHLRVVKKPERPAAGQLRTLPLPRPAT